VACAVLFACLLAFGAGPVAAQPPGEDVVMKALADELQRSMTLRLEDLDPPYFIQYTVDDSTTYRLSASYGALVSSTHGRSRVLYAQVRVGSYELDNSNFAGRAGFGGGRSLGGAAELPTDNDYLALRHAVWSATDSLYKSSAATLAQKRAYMRDRNVDVRALDFTRPESPVTELRGPAAMSFDRPVWEDYVRAISRQFTSYPQIHDAGVNLAAVAETRYLANAEGSRLRYGSTGVTLRITAQTQAPDGERLSDSLSFFAWTPDELPKIPAVLADVKAFADRLAGISQGVILEDYVGPVLFDGLAAPQLFRQLLAQGLAAQADPIGAVRRSGTADDLQSRLGKRILPVTFQIYDDPRRDRFQDATLTGHYPFDDEAVPPERVDLVVDGMLKSQVTSRTPTKDFARSSGHGRRGAGAGASAAIGCLFVESSKGATAEELKQELIDAAEAEGLKFGLKVTSLQNRALSGFTGFAGGGRRGGPGGGGGATRLVGDPIAIYKVHVADGREEPVRGCEFVGLDVRSLRRIIAAGKTSSVHNTTGSAASSVVAPAVLFEELELTRIRQEPEKKPILAGPHAR
jgi:hypothetical protein